MIYTHVLNRGPAGVRSPADRMSPVMTSATADAGSAADAPVISCSASLYNTPNGQALSSNFAKPRGVAGASLAQRPGYTEQRRYITQFRVDRVSRRGLAT